MEPTPRPRPTVGVTRRAFAIGTGALALTGALTGWFAAETLDDDPTATTLDQPAVTEEDPLDLGDRSGDYLEDDDDDDDGFSFDEGGSIPSQPDSSSSVS